MEISELRIGNYVDSIYGVVKVTSVGEYGISSIKSNSTTHIKSQNLKPCVITPKLLSENYFTPIEGENDMYQSDALPVNMVLKYTGEYGGTQVLTREINEKGLSPYRYLVSKNCRAVHQLQNLIFSLTGKEWRVIV